MKNRSTKELKNLKAKSKELDGILSTLKKPAIRKPRDLTKYVLSHDYALTVQKDDVGIFVNVDSASTFHEHDVKEIRKLAAWLSQSADYIEQSTRKKSI